MILNERRQEEKLSDRKDNHGKKEKEPAYYRSALNTPMLNYRVYVMGLGERFFCSLLTLAAGGCVGLIFYGGLFRKDGVTTTATVISNIIVFVMGGLISLKMFLPAIVENKRKKRLAVLKSQFRDFLSTLSTAMSSGMNMHDSIANAYKDLEAQYTENAYIVQELAELAAGMKNNVTIEDMLSDFGGRSGVEDIENFAVVFSTCYRTGGNLKEVVKRTAEIIGEKLVIAEEIETKLTSNKMQMMVMNVIPIILVFMMKTMSSDFAEGFTNMVGVIATTFSAGIFMMAYKLGQKIMDIKG